MKRILAVITLTICLPLCLSAQENKGLSGVPKISQGAVMGGASSRCFIVAFGVQHFYDGSIPQLKFPDGDCQKFIAAARTYLEFDYDLVSITLPEDKVKRTFQAARDLLEGLRKMAGSGDLVLFYLSGHGLTDSRNQYYFPLYDSVRSYYQDMLTGTHITEFATALSEKGANVLVFLDTCESGGMTEMPGETGGPGAIAYFPASGSEEEITENLRLSSSEYGNALCNLFNGLTADRHAYLKDLSVGTIGEQLKKISGQDPTYVNPRGRNISDMVLVRGLSEKREYINTRSLYSKYISDSYAARSSGQYDKALDDLENAFRLDKDIRPVDRDRYDLGKHILALNNAMAEECRKEDYSSKAWSSLSSINVSSLILDKKVVDLSRLFLGCGYYYKKGGDMKNAYNQFEKSYNLGNRSQAPYEMASVAKESGRLSDSEIKDLYRIAADAGNPEAIAIVYPNIEVKGLVYSADKQYLPGVIVKQEGTRNSSRTQERGQYTINVPRDGKLTVSCNGYMIKTVSVNNRSRIDIQLEREKPLSAGEKLKKSIKESWSYYQIGGGYAYTPNYPLGFCLSGGLGIVDMAFSMGWSTPMVRNSFHTQGDGTIWTPTFCWSVRPAVSYKYVGVGVGLGKVYSISTIDQSRDFPYTDRNGQSFGIDTYANIVYPAQVDSGNYFTVSPMLLGNIPLGYPDEALLELSLGAGYMFCPGRKERSGFTFTICLRFNSENY